MIPCKHSEKKAVLCGLLGLLLALTGCVNVGLKKAYPDIRTYSLDAGSQQHTTAAGAPVSIRINPFSAVPNFGDRYLTYRTGGTSYEQDFYNQFMASPAKIIEAQISDWMKESPLVSFVIPADSEDTPAYVIEGKLADLSGDYRNVAEAKAVLKIQLTVGSPDPKNPKVLFQKMYASEIPIGQPSPKLLTEGWSQGLGRIMAEFENDLNSVAASVSH